MNAQIADSRRLGALFSAGDIRDSVFRLYNS